MLKTEFLANVESLRRLMQAIRSTVAEPYGHWVVTLSMQKPPPARRCAEKPFIALLNFLFSLVFG